MPYSKNANGELRSPGGCKLTNGRCFAGIHFDLVCGIICFEFSDGSFYYDPARHTTEGYAGLCNRHDPGCQYNGATQAGRASGLLKGRPPFFDLSAKPPDYTPVGKPRENPEEYFQECKWP